MQTTDINPALGHQFGVAKQHLAATHVATDAKAGNCGKAGGVGQRQFAGQRAVDDRLAQWMFGVAFQRCGQGQNLILLKTRCRHDVGQLRLTLGNGAGLVEHNGVEAHRRLQCIARADQDAIFGAFADADGERGRCCQPQGTRAGDNQRGDHDDDGVDRARLGAEVVPDYSGQQRQNHYRRHKIRRHRIHYALDRRLRALGVLHHADDVGERGILADLGGPKAETAGFVERGADDFVAGMFLDRQRLTGDH